MPIPLKRLPKAPPPAQRNDMCDDCTTNAAVCFCVCLSQVRKRCQRCHETHSKDSPAVHYKYPMTAYTVVTSGTVQYETFKKKQRYINYLLELIGGEMAPLDAFMEQAEQEFDELLRLVETTKATFLLELRAQRGKLAAALSQINQITEAKRYEETFPVETNLDDYILNGYKDSRNYKTEMFTGTIELKAIKDLLGKIITYRLREDRLFYNAAWTPSDIPILKGNSLRLYNSSTYQLTQRTLNQTPRIDNGTAYCYILDDIVLCCGGDTQNLVYEVNVQNGIVNQVASMSQNRRWAGIFNWNGKHVYIFGGLCNGAFLSSVEKYDLGGKIWVTVPSMQKAKHVCSVCQHSSGLYVSGRDDSAGQTTIEFFNPLNEIYNLLYTDSGMPGILYCVRDELYHIQTTKIGVASLANSQSVLTFQVKGTISQMGNGVYWLCFPACFNNEEVVGVLTTGGTPCGVFSFNPSKVQFAQVANFTY